MKSNVFVKFTFSFLLCFSLLLLSGCNDVYLLDDRPEIGPNKALLLLDIQGERTVNYVQLGGVFPAINLRFKGKTNETLAIVVPVGIKGININSFSYEPENLISGFLPPSYIAVNSDPLNVSEEGIYFIGTLDTTTKTFSPYPDSKRLSLVKEKYASQIKGLLPLNFIWP